MIRKSGYRFSEKIMLKQLKERDGVSKKGHLALATETTQRTSFDARSFRLSDYRTLASQTSRPPATLFAADAERRQGLHHAGRDRLALRSASRRLQQRRTEKAGVLVAEPERQDPGDPRSGWPRGKAARPVRVGCDPAISRREDRKAAPD